MRNIRRHSPSASSVIFQLPYILKMLIPLALFIIIMPAEAQEIANRSSSASGAGDIRINEFMASNSSVLIDEDGDYSDWLELYNAGSTAVDLTGWFLSDDSTNLKKWTFPTFTLGAGEYLIVFASNKNRTAPLLHTNFKLSGSGEFLALTQPDTSLINSEFRPAYPIQTVNVSYGTHGSSPYYFNTPTPGAINASGTVSLYLTDDDVDENSPNDTYIGTFITTDVDTSVSITYTLTDDAGGRFKAVGDQLQVANTNLIDFETDSTHQITARTTYGSTTLDRSFTIEVDQVLTGTGVIITEIMSGNTITLQDEDGDYSDWIEIHNNDTAAVDLDDWFLTDDSTNLSKWKFPSISIPAGDYMVIFASDKDRNVGELHTNFKLSSSGEYLALIEPDTVQIATEYRPSFPLQISDVSFGALNDSLVYFSTPTPDAANSTTTVTLFLSDNRISESSPNDTYVGTVITSDIDTATTTTYSMTDDAGGRFKIVGNEIQVANSSLLDFATDSTHQVTVRSTYGSGNTADETFTIYLEQQYSTDLEISEFMADNGATLQDEDGDYSDWIEIHNTGSSDINLEDWYITDNDGNLTKWQFPSRVITAGGYLVIFASDKERTGAELHTNFKLGAGGEYLGLVQPNGNTVVSEYSPEYPAQSEDVSYGIFNSAAQFFSIPTPGSANTDGSLPIDPLTISPERGYYSSSFDVTISTPTSGVDIRYTLDGSKPTPSNGSLYSGPITVDTTTVIRAAAYKSGYQRTDVETHTYLFLSYVIEQPFNISGYPINSYSVAGSDEADHDYEMDPTIVDDPAYSGSIIKGLTDIPSIMISIHPDSLFGANSFYDNLDVEKGVSMEYLDFHRPDRNDQIDCGITGHSHLRLKRSMRLLFRSEYGESSWRSKIFEDAPINGGSAHKDQKRIVLRAGNNRSWARKWNPEETTHTEDQWFRDTRIEMSGHGSHGNFAHVYINGIYWGLYNPVERPDHHFSAEYFGGDSEDWYAHSHSGSASGDDTRFDYMTDDLVFEDMSDSTKYAEMQEYLDIPNFIDYMMLSWYGAVTDWPGKNYWGGNRNSPTPGPFMFYNWDAEWSWDVTKDFPSVSGAWVHPSHRAGVEVEDVHSELWASLRENDNFMMEFADRVYLHCFNGGALTDSSSLARWDTLNNYVRDAIIPESAKWGDCQIHLGNERHTRDLHWQAEVDAIAALMDGNTAQFITALRAENYYPDIDPPTFNQRGGDVDSGFQVSLTNPNGSGTIYFTTDGTDPRTTSNGIYSGAMTYASPITLTDDTIIKTRVLDSGEWSAIDTVDFDVSAGTAVVLRVKVFLEGAYNSSTGEMRTDLRSGGHLPLASPYPENPRSVLTMPSTITDWVLVQLRSTNDGSAMTSRSVLLRNDGRIVGDDGTTEYVMLDAPDGPYYIVIKHRNHLAIMTPATEALNSFSTLYDFTGSQGAAYTDGSDALKDLGGAFGMFSSDANNDGQVTSSDFNTFLPAARTAQQGYHVADWNLDGQVTSSDFNLFNPNARNAANSQVPGESAKTAPVKTLPATTGLNHAN